MRLLLTLMILAAALPLLAQQDDRYVVRLDPAAAVDRVDVLAAQLAAAHGASVLATDSATEDTIVLRVSPSRVRTLKADPRVQSVTSLKVAAEAIIEPVNWSVGVPYTYDGAGSVKTIGNGTDADAFVYDAVGRLVQAKVNKVTRTYEYDAFGNRKKCAAPDTDCQYAMEIDSRNNRLVENDTTKHDPAGNVSVLGPHAYSYDAMNMMTRDHSAAGNYEYLYTADEERLATYNASTGIWEWTVRDSGGKVLREFTSPNAGGTWQWKRDYVYRDGLLLASRVPFAAAFTTHHYHLDHLGSARRITGDDDRIIGYHDYYAFGPEISGSLEEPDAAEIKYTGHEHEPGNDQYTLDYMHARFYNPTLGRFLSSDPGRDWSPSRPQTWNLYAYARNNPFSFFDPDGLKARLYTYIGFTNPGPKSELPTAKAIAQQIRTELGERVVHQRLQMNPKASRTDFRTGLTDTEGISLFIGHAYYPGAPGLMFDRTHSEYLQNLTNNNSLILLGGCDTAGYASLFGIGDTTTGKAFVGFAGQVNSMVLAEMMVMVVKELEKGKTIGDAVNVIRKELASRGVKASDFRVVLKGDINVKVTKDAFQTEAPK